MKYEETMRDSQSEGCPEYQDEILALIDGQLAHVQRQSVENHLAQCPDCRAALAEFRALDRRLAREIRPIVPGANFKQSLMARVQSETAPPRLAVSEASSRLRGIMRVSVVLDWTSYVVLALLLVFGVASFGGEILKWLPVKIPATTLWLALALVAGGMVFAAGLWLGLKEDTDSSSAS